MYSIYFWGGVGRLDFWCAHMDSNSTVFRLYKNGELNKEGNTKRVYDRKKFTNQDIMFTVTMGNVGIDGKLNIVDGHVPVKTQLKTVENRLAW